MQDFVSDDMEAEEIVQNLFMKLWEKKADLETHTSIKAFLYRSVYHDSLNYLKQQKVKFKYQQHQAYVMKDVTSASKLLHTLRSLNIVRFSIRLFPAYRILKNMEFYAGPTINHIFANTPDGEKMVKHDIWKESLKTDELNAVTVGFMGVLQMYF